MKNNFWPRAIMHADMDAFFASVEQLDHPEWRGKPVIVGGPAESRGVVSAASYEARKYGVRSAMPMAQAKLRCPHAIFTRGSHERYGEVSAVINSIFHEFTPLVEPISIDEAFLDVTGSQRLFGTPKEIAITLKQTVKEKSGLTVSVGVAPTKFVAKIASDLDKPDGLVVIPEGKVADRLAPLPVSRIWGAGPRTVEVLEKLGIHTIGDLRRWPLKAMQERFGVMGEQLYNLSHGLDVREVETLEETKSVSNEYTFAKDETDADALKARIEYLADKVASRMRAHGFIGKVVTLKVRYEDFSTVTRRRTISEPCALSAVLFKEAWDLLQTKTEALTRPVRLVGVGFGGIVNEGQSVQKGLFDLEDRARIERMERTTDRIREKMGRDAIRRGVHIKPPGENPKDNDYEPPEDPSGRQFYSG